MTVITVKNESSFSDYYLVIICRALKAHDDYSDERKLFLTIKLELTSGSWFAIAYVLAPRDASLGDRYYARDRMPIGGTERDREKDKDRKRAEHNNA